MRLAHLTLVASSLLASLSHGATSGTLSLDTGSPPVRFNGVSHALFSSSKLVPEDPDSPSASVLRHETQLRADWGRYTAGIGFTNRLSVKGAEALNAPFTLEKKFVGADWGNWQLRAGDTYQELGRGIALSLYRDTVFGLDTTVEGAATRYRPRGLDVNLFGGRVNAYKSPVAVNSTMPDPTQGRLVLLAGGAVTGAVTSNLKLGGHYLFTTTQPPKQAYWDTRWHTAGLTLNVEEIFPAVDFYVESNMLVKQPLIEEGGPQRMGYGSYGAVTWSPLPWRAKLEVKDYRKYEYDFRRPPTLEDDVVESLNTQDVSAGRLYGERRIGGGKSNVYGAYLLGDDRQKKVVVNHGVVGGKIGIGARGAIEWKGGHRWEGNDARLWHASLKGAIPTFTGQTLEIGFRKVNRDTITGTSVGQGHRNMVDVTYTFSEKFSVQGGYENWPTNAVADGRHFVNGTVTYKASWLMAKAFVGQTGGGTLCSGGVCRQILPFTGAMLETTVIF